MFHGEKQSKIIKIHNTEEDTMFITVVGEYDGIKIKVEPSVLLPAKYGNITVHFNSESKNFGKASESLQFEIKIDNEKLNGDLILHTNIFEDFSKLTSGEKANPPKIKILQDNRTRVINDLKPGELKTEVIELENIGTRDLQIRNIQSYDNTFTIKPTSFNIEPGNKGTFTISVTPNGGTEKLKSIITIISNDPIQSVLNFTIIGNVNLPKGSIVKAKAVDIPVGKAASLVKSSKGKDDFVILDVRTDDEFNNGCLEDAVNIDFNGSNFRKMLKLMDKSKTYLVYCQSGIRSRKAIEQMSDIGFKNIYHMHEGIEGWKAKRLKLVDPNI
jgi:rhodanese-related sulfurtransferase